MTESATSQTSANQRLSAPRYQPDRLPFETEGLLRQALDVARSVHQKVDAPEFVSYQGSERRAARNHIAKVVRPREQAALYLFARDGGLLLDNSNFNTKWKAGGERGETENEVYYDPVEGGWVKRNDLSYHGSYLEFFQRVALHNRLFPEAPLELMGFVVDRNRNVPESERMLKPVVFQPHIESPRGATREEVRSLMAELGFIPVHNNSDNYVNRATGIRVEDLHSENVLVNDGELFVIDPVIYLDEDGKMGRLKGNLESGLTTTTEAIRSISSTV